MAFARDKDKAAEALRQENNDLRCQVHNIEYDKLEDEHKMLVDYVNRHDADAVYHLKGLARSLPLNTIAQVVVPVANQAVHMLPPTSSWKPYVEGLMSGLSAYVSGGFVQYMQTVIAAVNVAAAAAPERGPAFVAESAPPHPQAPAPEESLGDIPAIITPPASSAPQVD